MQKLRTIDSAFAEIKALDPDTAITKYRIRQIVTGGYIPCKKAGKKYVFDLDVLLAYFNSDI